MKKLKISKLIIFSVSLVLILFTLFAGENITLFDNGDYIRIMRLASLEKGASEDIKIALSDFGLFSNIKNVLFETDGFSTYPSSQIIPVRLSVAVNLVFNKIAGLSYTTYNLSFLGIIYSIFYALALTFTLSKLKFRNKYHAVLITSLFLIVMCDIGYVSYFNSLYGEGLQHILLVVLAGFIIDAFFKAPNFSNIILFSIFLICYGTSKFFNIPCAVLFGIIYFLLILSHKPDLKKKISSSLALVVSVLVLVFSMAGIPDWISEQTNYNAVFYGILKDTDDETAKEYLRDLGFDESYHELKNTNFYVSDIAKISETKDLSVFRELSYVDLLMFYLKHPVLTVNKMIKSAKHSGLLRNIFFMDSDRFSDNHRLKMWSVVRENTGFDTLFINTLITLLFVFMLFFIIIKYKKEQKILLAVPVLLFITLCYSFIVPYISNGDADLAKHMYNFLELIDIAFLFIVVTGLCFSQKNILRYSCIAILIIGKAFSIFFEPDIIDFGGYRWYVIDENEEYKTLIAKDSVINLSYNTPAKNTYSTSHIREWLNGEFLESFSEDELSKLHIREHKVIVSAHDKQSATLGNRDFYCSPYASLCDDGYDSAYGITETDLVLLPNVKHIALMAEKNYKFFGKEKYWLETPYFNHPEKVRFVNTDGLLYFASADEVMGIRPVIYLSN